MKQAEQIIQMLEQEGGVEVSAKVGIDNLNESSANALNNTEDEGVEMTTVWELKVTVFSALILIFTFTNKSLDFLLTYYTHF